MQPTNSVREFIQKNDQELRYMVSSLCGSHNVADSSVNDIVQDFYFRAISGNIIESYDPNFSKGNSKNPKMSTYLFPIISNLIKTTRKQPENRLIRNKFVADPNIEESYDMDEIELALRFNQVALDYEGILHQNESDMETLGYDLKDFERKFMVSRSNKKYNLKKRKDKSITTGDLSILDVYNHLKNGLSSREIARMYGVSDMFICILKKCIARNILRHGIMWKPRSNKSYHKLTPVSKPIQIQNPPVILETMPASIKKWSDADIFHLRESYQEKTLSEVAKEMGRSVCSIKSKIYKLGIRKS